MKMSEERIAVITPYFNPCGYENIRKNYLKFSEEVGVDLYTIELEFDWARGASLPVGDRVWKIRGTEKNVLWQKERLINRQASKIAAMYDYIAWVDCDILFQNENWRFELAEILQEKKMVQLFESATYLGIDGVANRKTEGLVKFCQSRQIQSLDSYLSQASYGASEGGLGWSSGLGWAMRSEFFLSRKLLDFQILGSADLHMAIAAVGFFEAFDKISYFTPAWREACVAWAEGFHSYVGGEVGYVTGNIVHLYHGSRKNRKYLERHNVLYENDYDPFSDIGVGGNGLWEWSSDKPIMHSQVAEYFKSRSEDG